MERILNIPRRRCACHRGRIVISDPWEFVRIGLRNVLEDAGYTVVGECATMEEAVPMAEGADVVVLDFPVGDSEETCRRIGRTGARVVFYAALRTGSFATFAQRSRAAGYVLKSQPVAAIVDAVDAAVTGHRYIPPVNGCGKDLTEKELKVVQLIVNGKSNKEIAWTMDVSVRTTECHRAAIRRKLGVDSVSALTRVAITEGIVA